MLTGDRPDGAAARRRSAWISRAAGLVGALVLAALALCAFTPLPNLLVDWTRVAPRLERADAIVVLGAGGPTPPGILDGPSLRKALYGIRLYRQGLAPLLVLSGAADSGRQREEVSLRVELAREYGVPEAAIVADTKGRPGVEPTTRGEAFQTRRLVGDRGVERILLVTDSEHMRRARRIFEEAGFSVLAAPIDEIALEASTPQDRLVLMRWIGQEWLARLYYALAGYL